MVLGAFAALAIGGSVGWALGWIGVEPTPTTSPSNATSNAPPPADNSVVGVQASFVDVASEDARMGGSNPQVPKSVSIPDAEQAAAMVASVASLAEVTPPWMEASLPWLWAAVTDDASAQTPEKVDEVGDPDFQDLLTTLQNCPSELPGDDHPGDPVVGAWVGMNRPNTAWSLFHLYSPEKGWMMQVVWQTFYPRLGGGATWLISEPAPIGPFVNETRTWSSTLKRPRFNVPGLGSQVGTVKFIFPNDSATHGVVEWTWSTENKEDGGSLPLPGVSDRQCLYLFGTDRPPQNLGPNLSAPPPSLESPPETPTAAGSYEGIWTDPSVPGYQIQVHEVHATELAVCAPGAPVVNCVPDNAGFPVNPQKPQVRMGDAQFFGLSIYTNDIDNNKRRPLWLYAQMGPYPSPPSPNWINTEPSDYNSTVVDLLYLTANYLINQDCTGDDCVTKTWLPKAHSDDPDNPARLIDGNFFGRAFHTPRTGVIGLKAKLAGSLTTPSINWPPAWPAYEPPGSTTGCDLGPGVSNPSDICRPVRMRGDNQLLKVDRTTCDVPTPTGTCNVTVSWNASLGAIVQRVEQASDALKPHGSDGGIISQTPWGSFIDTLGADEYVRYRLLIGTTKIVDISVRAGYSRISAPSSCLLTLVDPNTNKRYCEVDVTWNTPDPPPPATSQIRVQRYISTGNGPFVPAGLLSNGVSSGTAPDRIYEDTKVYYALQRGTYQLSSTSTNPTIPALASVTPTPTVCPVSTPLGQTTCPVTIRWVASTDAQVRRMTVGSPSPCDSSTPDCVLVGTGTGANGPKVDDLPLGRNVYYIVNIGSSELARSSVVKAAASTITINNGNASSCTVPTGQETCSITVQWSSVPEALVYRVDEIGGGRTPIPTRPEDACGGPCAIERLAPGARVHYELMINGVLHAISSAVTASTDTEGGDSDDGGTPDSPAEPVAFAEPALDVESDKVGAIAGEFRVDEGGGATYRIPLAVSPGAGGFAPSLALTYNSAGGDGSLGTGFSMEGVSAIATCRPSVEAGDGGEPTADPSEFCLDGQRLLLVRNTHRQIGAEYRTEVESFQRIKLTAIENIGLPGHDATGYVFTIEGKDGSVRTFGGAAGTVSSRSAVGSDTTSGSGGAAPAGQTQFTAQGWLQTQLKDAVGNAIAFQYSAETGEGERYLEKISYSGGSILFSYIGSPRIDVAYSARGPRWQSKLVSGIEVKAANGNTLRHYKPAYNFEVSAPFVPPWTRGRPTLVSLKECSREGGVCYPATSLTWSFASAYTDEVNGLLPAKPGGYYQLGDLNGDGRADIWWTSSPDGQIDQKLHISTYTSDTSSGQPTLHTIDPGMLFPNGFLNGGLWEILDADGDGRDDLLYVNNSPDPPNQNHGDDRSRMGWHLRRSTGNGLSTTTEEMISVPILWNKCEEYGSRLAAEMPASGSTNGTVRYLGSSLRADVDGDGLGDIVFRACDGRFWVALMKQTGDLAMPHGFTVTEAKFVDGNGNPLGSNRCGYATTSLLRKEENFSQATDFDGDGRADLRFLIDARNCVGLPGAPAFRLDVYLAKGIAPDGTFEFRVANPLGPTPAIQFNFDKEGIAEAGQRLRTLDFNGDGLTDLIYQAPNGQWRYRLGGPHAADNDARAGDALLPNGIQADSRTMQLLDFDGDGKLDLWQAETVRAGSPEVYTAVYLWSGSNWSSTAIANTDYTRPGSDWLYAVGDFDGDGAIDSFTAKLDEQGRTTSSDDRVWKLRRPRSHHQSRGLLTQIRNGFGATTDIEYAPLTFSSVYRRDYNAPFVHSGRGSAVFDVAGPSYVVRSIASSAPSDGVAGAKSKVSYSYAGLKVQAGGRGSLGFRRVSSDFRAPDMQTRTTVDTQYLQRFPYTGLADFTETRIFPLSQPDYCGSGVTATPDSPLCMKYVPPCPAGLNVTCEEPDSSPGLVIKESADQWQFRKGGVGGGLGALRPQCIPAPLGTGAGSSNAPEPSDSGAGPCPSGWRMASPEEVDQQTLTTGNAAPIFLARIQSLTSNYDLRWGISGGVLSSESMDFAIEDYDDYGNPLAGETSKSGGGTSVSTTSTFDYGNDETGRRLGRLRTASVTTARTMQVNGMTRTSTNVRRSSFGYDAKGLLASERVEGMSGTSVDTAAPAVAKYYFYDGFGNKIRTSVCSTSIPENTCRQQTVTGGNGFQFHPSIATDVMRHSSVEYEASGRFANTVYEWFESSGAGGAQQVSSTVSARNDGGDPLEVFDFNRVNAKLRYGALGRKRYTWSPDGAWTRWDARFCTGVTVPSGTPTVACPTGMVYQATTTKAGAPTGIVYYDVLGRPAVTLTQGFAANSWIAIWVQYDARGNVKRQSEPFFASNAGAGATTAAPSTSIVWTETLYDDLSRPIELRRPGQGTTTIAYDGLKTTTTLPENGSGLVQTAIEIKNGLGEVVRTIDANNYETLTFYDAGGNPTEIRRGAQVTTMGYDRLGRKTTMSDPDAGAGWTYKVNGAGEVIRQVSPRGTCTTNEYDGRGRVWRRRDYATSACTTAESESKWTYDTALMGVGKLAQESNGQVVRNVGYDGKGRLNRLDASLEGKSYSEEWKFDAFGRPFQHFFQMPGVPKTGEQSSYQNGYPQQVRSAYPLRSGIYPVYREIQRMNARGQVEKERVAAGAEYVQEREFDANTGRVKRLLAQSPAAGFLQDVHYNYDWVGNVTSRVDSNGPLTLTETFGYDSLQRLLTSTVSAGGQPTYARSQNYDAQGNILSKSDVSTAYTYGTRPAVCGSGVAPGPHAVASAGTTTALCYDANGNVVKRQTPQGMQTITYSAADQAIEITDLSNRVRFGYGPNRERLRRVDYAGGASVVHFIGGAEVRYAATASEGAGTLMEVRRYIGNVLSIQRGSGASYSLKRQVLLSDRQGSTHLVLGAMTLRPVNQASPMSFDAWGRRRDGQTWGDPPPWMQNIEPLLKESTTHGYTGHEMVESVGLIHMNGRLYDQQLARFLQADPFVQRPGDGQNWNRYSYAFNNPLAYTDPTGNMSMGDILRTAAVVAITVYSGGAAAGSWSFLGLTVTQGTAGAYAVAAVGGFAAGAVQTGSLKGAVTGAVTAGVFYGIGSAFSFKSAPSLYEMSQTMKFSGYAAKTLSHGIAGGVMAELQGGRFGHGFAAAGVSEALSPAPSAGDGGGMIAAKTVAAAVIGGTASSLAGGKFANGAVTAAFGYSFNSAAHMAMYWANKTTAEAEQAWVASEPIRSAAVDELLGFIPGYDVANCAINGCGMVGWSIAAIGVIPGGKGWGIAAKGAEGITKEILVRKALGRDGALSRQIIERENGAMISRTHEVTRDGGILHQHQNHTGKYGGERQFPSEWTGTETINAPYESYLPNFGPDRVPSGRTF